MPASYVIGDQPVPGAGYRLASFLGRGGFGEVWKVTAPGGAEAALKIIRLGSREGRKELRALQLVKRIHHTHLVPIIAFWIKNDKGEILDDAAVLAADRRETAIARVTAAAPTAPLQAFVETAALQGPAELIIAMGLGDQSLFDRLEKCRNEGLPGIPDEELLGYLEDSAEAIDFLNRPIHDLGSGLVAIQHCDIKPHNLVLVGGSVQVCDFGLARMMGADRATTAAASVAYAAPECLVEGKPSDTTDQYCLAVTFIELMSGQLPYEDLTMAAVIDAKRNNKLDFHMLPASLRPVLRRATNSDPAKRYGSCREMVSELRRVMEGGTATTPVSAGMGRSPSSSRGGAGKLFVAAVVVAAAAACGFWAYRTYMPNNEAIVPVVNKTTGESPKVVSNGDANQAPRATGSPAKGTESTARVSTTPDPAEAARREGEKLLASGTEFLNHHDYVRAAADLERAGKLMPRNFHVFSRLGVAWAAQHNWDKAIKSYTKSIDIEPDSNDYLARGQAYLELKDADRAMADFVAAVRLNPNNARAYVELGDAYLDKDHLSHAIEAYSEAVRICTSDASAYPQWNARLLRAGAYLLAKRKAQAADDLTHVMRLVPRNDAKSVQSVLDAIDDLIKEYADAGQFADAVKWAENSVELAPDTATKDGYQQRLKELKAKESAARSNHSTT
jgi:serine/threonine protein kinase/Flp pilus assembly protein TadD